MSEESTTPDLAEINRKTLDAVNRRDFDALLAYAAPDVVYDTSPSGFGVYQGEAVIRDFIEGYWRAFEDLRFDLEEFVDLGNGVTFSVNHQHARPVGSAAPIQAREAHVTEWADGLVVRMTVYNDIDEGRAAAERLAESRGQAMAQENAEVVRRFVEALVSGRDWQPVLADLDNDVEIDDLDISLDTERYRRHDGSANGSTTGAIAGRVGGLRTWRSGLRARIG